MEAHLALQTLQSIVSYLIMVLSLSFLVWEVEGQTSDRFDADGSVTLVAALVALGLSPAPVSTGVLKSCPSLALTVPACFSLPHAGGMLSPHLVFLNILIMHSEITEAGDLKTIILYSPRL